MLNSRCNAIRRGQFRRSIGKRRRVVRKQLLCQALGKKEEANRRPRKKI